MHAFAWTRLDTLPPLIFHLLQPILAWLLPCPLFSPNRVLANARAIGIFGCNAPRRRVPLHAYLQPACARHGLPLGTWPPVVCDICSKRRTAGINQHKGLPPCHRGAFRALRTMRDREANLPPQHSAPLTQRLSLPYARCKDCARPCRASGWSGMFLRGRACQAAGDGQSYLSPLFGS